MAPTLRVQIFAARNLLAKDMNGSSDPFVVVELGKQSLKTQIVMKNLNPEWNEELDFELPMPPPLSLKLTVWDWDKVGRNDFLGVAYIPIEEVLTQRMDDQSMAAADRSAINWLPLRQRSASSRVQGEIQIRAGIVGDGEEVGQLAAALAGASLTRSASTRSGTSLSTYHRSTSFSTLSAAASITADNMPAAAREVEVHGGGAAVFMPAFTLRRLGKGDVTKELDGVLTLDVIGADNLPPLRNATKTSFDMDPFCVVSLGDRVHRTRTIKHSLCPEWNERVILPVTHLAAAQWPVAISVYDWDKFSGNDFIGSVDIMIGDLRARTDASQLLTIPLTVSGEYADALQTPASIKVRAVYRPIAEVRDALWRKLVVSHAGGDQTMTSDELDTLLEVLGANNIDDAEREKAYAEIGKAVHADLTIEEAVKLMEIIFKVNLRDDTLTKMPKCPSCSFVFTDGGDVIAHLENCLDGKRGDSSDMMMGGFVTEANTSRKGMTHLLNKLTRGEYSIGADSANIIVINRINGQLTEEKIPTFVRLGIRMLYRISTNAVETARIKRMLQDMSVKQGVKYTDSKSVKEIPGFIKYHKLDTAEMLEPLESFKNFNEFFYRKLKPGVRPLASPYPEIAVSGADARLMAFPTIAAAQELWIKGRNFTVDKLVGSAEEGARYVGGSLVILRLAPQDYHRFHVPVDGVLSETTEIQGAYFTVNPMAIRSSVDVYLENKRAVTYIDSPVFGRVAFVAIGAMMVGSIVQTTKTGQHVARGDEHGFFAFGGSTVVLLFEPGRIELDADLVANSTRKLETLVRVGMSIGRKPNWSAPDGQL
ncbi:phosphatidylserine decarboxylase-domain-containing protein [Blastocladiella britannica]|nr:phosphatidylserine decarboxylase-domain-containing protein [Blastocladiella britannica]